MTKALAKKGRAAATAITNALGLKKSAGPMDDYSGRIDSALDAYDWDWRDLDPIIEPYLAGVAVAAGTDALSDFGLFDESTLALMRRDAVAYAMDRAAEMVGMQRHGELLLPNSNADWTIADATRDMLRGLVTDALDEGWSPQELKSAIRESAGFGADRAETIARTELAMADTKGTISGWKATGLVAGKQWDAAPDCCDECQMIDGLVVGIDEEFPDGDPPLHPNCRCSVEAVLDDELPDHGDDSED